MRKIAAFFGGVFWFFLGTTVALASPYGSGTYGSSTYDSSGTSSTSSSGSGPVFCTDTAPGTAPKLYGAIAQSNTSVLLYFTEADDPVTTYVLEYGTISGTYEYSARDIGKKGSRTYLVQSLSPGKTYYFRVRAGNGCATGAWSNELSSKTKISSSLGGSVHIVDSQLTPVEYYPTPTPSQVGKSTSLTPTPAPIGYRVKVKVQDTAGQAVKGASVTMHSTPMTKVTDSNGDALFEQVEPGEHNVLIAYNGYEGEQQINLTGDTVKTFELKITIQQKNVWENTQVRTAAAIGGGVILLLLGIVIIVARRRRVTT